MGTENYKMTEKAYRRKFGAHITSTEIFDQFIFPEIQNDLENHIWVDLFAGEGNLVLPILNHVNQKKRSTFFKNHIFLFDIQEKMVKKCIENARDYNIPEDLATLNIKLRDNLIDFPKDLLDHQLPIYHITNPPYLYLGYIKKHPHTKKYLTLFEGRNKGYQDLYQIAMINDLRNEIENMIYIIPSNFLFGASVSNKFRKDFLPYYSIKKVIIFETQIFEFTGTNICITCLTKKTVPKDEIIVFDGTKIKQKSNTIKKKYILNPNYNYRAGFEFTSFIEKYSVKNPLKVNYYLLKNDVVRNKGPFKVEAIDANEYSNNKYKKIVLTINKELKNYIENNVLYVKTVDSGTYQGRVGLGLINEDLHVSAILVSGNTYRTHPIQLFFTPNISIELQLTLKKYFNFTLEYFRNKTDSEFLTTYKYSSAPYTRKYLGLTQARRLIETFPYSSFNPRDLENLNLAISNQEFQKLVNLLNDIKERQK